MTPEEEILQQPAVRIDVNSLTFADSPRLSGINLEHVESLVATQNPVPPIIVHRSSMRVIDGAHRLKAAMLRGDETIVVRFFDGTDADAFVLAVRLNVAHGLPLVLADRKRAAERIVRSHPEWSDRRVSAVTGLSPGTVADVRNRIGDPTDRVASRVGQDGRVRPLDGSAGRRLAGQLMREKPHLSLRQVAQAASISPETARDVRNRLRNGEDLVPGRVRRAAAGVGPAVDRRAEVSTLTPARPPVRPQQAPVANQAAILNRLKADPALRYSETGRNLLRLLTLHSLWAEDWESIIQNLPPHCSGALADVARQFSTLWADFATRATKDMAKAG
ncbi:ParB N-terminal domain-containing protein [Luedemannella flava]|uniref:ParB N-terminal domain-containing protein n=1 Tax=Luedemannella flava TaxID=349316 RepID=A0ABN2LD51_9ACTN